MLWLTLRISSYDLFLQKNKLIIFPKIPLRFFFILVIFLIPIKSNSQIFQKVENSIGLGKIKKNNGFSVADYDKDGDLDLFIVAFEIEDPSDPSTFSKLFRNNNDGSFTDVTLEAGFINLFTIRDQTKGTLAQQGFKFGASWGDYNNDGYPDLLLTYSLKIQLWLNLGNGTFENVTESSGITASNDCINTGATWFDYDNDGFLDFYVNDWNSCGSNFLYRNNGDGTFTDLTSELNLVEAEPNYSYTAMPFDLNNDGWLDIIVSNDLHYSNYAYINNNGLSFTESAISYGMDSRIDDMGIAVSDFDNDLDFDIFFTGVDENNLMENNGNNFFQENSSSHGLESSGWSWGASFADFDLDGDEDLFIVNGYEFEARGPERNIYYRNLNSQGENKFENISNDLGIDELSESVENIGFDYDNDGDLDLMITNSDAPVIFYENKLLNFDDDEPYLSWLKIELEGTSSNKDALGAIITVTSPKGVQKRHYSGVGFLGQSLQPIHFGLNNDSKIDNLKIKWPSGIIENYTNLDVNKNYKAIEGQGIEIQNKPPSKKIYGCTDPDSCNYNPTATYDDGSCTYLTSKFIIGSNKTSFLNVETYSYNTDNTSTNKWEIEGGEILSGQGTDSISVKWGVASGGTVSVVESNDNCSSLKVSLEVDLDAKNLPNGISIARLWNEVLLESIRGDFTRPTVHARNLFHSGILMYDIWAISDEVALPYLMGNKLNGFQSDFHKDDFEPIYLEKNKLEYINEAISFGMFRLLSHRFNNSPTRTSTQLRLEMLMDKLGYDSTIQSIEYKNGNASALGNYVAKTIIEYGLQDGSREATGYDNAYYNPINLPYSLNTDQSPAMEDPNRWQPLGLDTFIDQGGNLIDGNVPPFLSPEWGNVNGFALKEEDKITFERNGNLFHVFHDPLEPPYINLEYDDEGSKAYKWGFSMVSIWQSHLDPNDGILWDISPAKIGNVNIESFPKKHNDYENFYNFFEGGSYDKGRSINPYTQKSYSPNIVPRGDYTRVLAEFWADGPDSETPPGHWFSILNYVNDNPIFEKRYQGKGPILDPLEWDVKSYFILGGGMHDAAIASWSVKGWYDYLRPISAIRSMVSRGQSSDPNLPNFNVGGIPLIPGYIELIKAGDSLSGKNDEYVGAIKLYTWRGHENIETPETDQAGVGWIRGSEWYPYQRPTFVTPPFAGYVSGHSTYSRAAAELLTYITGDEYFPGGIGEFVAKANEFLVFEEGPSVDITLQWATYRDASDQTSLSRIWGGIHPPADDIPGRFIGQLVASDTFELANRYFEGIHEIEENLNKVIVYPNPITNRRIYITNTDNKVSLSLYDAIGQKVKISNRIYDATTNTTMILVNSSTKTGLYILHINEKVKRFVIIKN